LPPGEYAFHVSACNSGGVWNDAVPVGIVLTPFLWQRAWFPWATVTAVATLITVGLVIWLRARHRRRLAALQQIQAIEKERLRIARDLHDDVGASLTQISNLGELASRRAEQPEALLEHLTRLREKSRETLQTLDQIVWTVNPRNDGLSRSTSYFTHTARDLLEGSGIRCRLRMPDELPAAQLTSQVRHHLLLVIKEAVRNVLKHSGADEMLLTIAADQQILTVTIIDNGHGFDPKQANHERNGLQNMARRLEELGGVFDLKTAPGKGTTITITVPLEPEQS
ncbi:MAG: sensor histidine kinase, partial [Verrucomicrobiota bacterium]